MSAPVRHNGSSSGLSARATKVAPPDQYNALTDISIAKALAGHVLCCVIFYAVSHTCIEVRYLVQYIQLLM
jgi:hypothetical protein